MSDIQIVRKNEVYIKVQCDPSIAQEISEHFTFDVPGAKFNPLFRNKMWDGKIRLFSVLTKEIYKGLLSYLPLLLRQLINTKLIRQKFSCIKQT